MLLKKKNRDIIRDYFINKYAIAAVSFFRSHKCDFMRSFQTISTFNNISYAYQTYF